MSGLFRHTAARILSGTEIMKILHTGLVALLAIAGGTLAACDSTSSGVIAGLGGSAADSLGRQQLVVSPSKLSLTVGSSFQLSTNAPTTLQSSLQWSVVNQTVATVSPDGAVLGATAGTTSIIVRYADDTTNVGTMTLSVVGAGNTADRAPR
jgi:hypothetical protein